MSGEPCIHEMVMVARLDGESEKREKDECARDERPAVQLESQNRIRVVLPIESRDLHDTGIVAVRVGPAFPGYDARLDVGHQEIYRQRNGPKYFDGGKGHQAEVAPEIAAAAE